MDALTEIRAKINDYPGYDSDAHIRLCDELIRAYVGERLADLQDRLEASALADTLEPLVVRSAFANLHVLEPLLQPLEGVDLTATVREADVALVAGADDAAEVTPQTLDAYIARMTQLFDARDASLVAAGIALG